MFLKLADYLLSLLLLSLLVDPRMFAAVFMLLCVSTVLCADRVGQMTKTYNDIDAVTRLLEEVRLRVFVLHFQSYFDSNQRFIPTIKKQYLFFFCLTSDEIFSI